MSDSLLRAMGFSRPLIPYETAVLALPEDGGECRRKVELGPATAFQPFALLFWSSTPGSRVHQIHVGAAEQLTGALPAVMFEAEVSWSYFLTLSERRPDGVTVIDHRSIGKFFRFDMPAVSPKGALAVDIEGAYRHGVVLGRVPRLSLPAPEPGVMGRDSGFRVRGSSPEGPSGASAASADTGAPRAFRGDGVVERVPPAPSEERPARPPAPSEARPALPDPPGAA